MSGDTLLEGDVGITCYIHPKLKGFTGILKQRYTDFLVNEMHPDGHVLHLTSYDLPPDQPPPPSPTTVPGAGTLPALLQQFADNFGHDTAQKLRVWLQGCPFLPDGAAVGAPMQPIHPGLAHAQSDAPPPAAAAAEPATVNVGHANVSDPEIHPAKRVRLDVATAQVGMELDVARISAAPSCTAPAGQVQEQAEAAPHHTALGTSAGTGGELAAGGQTDAAADRQKDAITSQAGMAAEQQGVETGDQGDGNHDQQANVASGSQGMPTSTHFGQQEGGGGRGRGRGQQVGRGQKKGRKGAAKRSPKYTELRLGPLQDKQQRTVRVNPGP